MFKIFYGFMSEKIKKRVRPRYELQDSNLSSLFHLTLQIFVHSTLEDLHKHVGKRLLPAEYGGDLGPLAAIAGELWL